MAGEWRKTTIGAAFSVNPLRPLKRGSVAPFIPMDALPQHARAVERIEMREYTGSGMRFCNGDTLIARITPCLENGKTAYVSGLRDGEIGHGSTEYIVLSGRPEVSDSLFGYYLARSPEFRRYAIGHMEGTSGRQRVPSSVIERFPVTLPPISEQRAIAHILGTLDDKIELNRKQNETLEAMARALFKAWFVDFEPVRAKMEGRWQRGQSLPGLPAHLYDLFPDRLVESELGEIPEGWGIATLPELIEVNPSRPLRKGMIAPYLDMANMPTRGHAPNEVIERPFGSGMRFINGDTLVARITPCLENGKTAFVDFLQDGQVAWGSTEYIVLRPRAPLPDEFAYCLARSDSFREFAIQSMTGTSGRQRVQAHSLAHYRLPRVPERVAEMFGHIIKPLFARSSDAVSESRALAALRDTLLPRLICGELRVKTGARIATETAL
jgi:type I restriction enzyme S subunit